MESMKRQFDFLNKDFEQLKEKCFLLNEINNIVCAKKLKNKPKIETLQKLSIFNFSDNIEENQKDSERYMRSSRVLHEGETPLLDSLMKKRRIREYKEKTILFQNSINIKKT